MEAKDGITAQDVVDMVEHERDESKAMMEFCKKAGNIESAKAFANEVAFADCLLAKIAV